MGGNALKHLDPVRLTSAEVIDLVHHLHRNWQLSITGLCTWFRGLPRSLTMAT